MDVLDQQDGLVQGDINRCYTFGLVGAIILALACVNFVNLSTARGANRAWKLVYARPWDPHAPSLSPSFSERLFSSPGYRLFSTCYCRACPSYSQQPANFFFTTKCLVHRRYCIARALCRLNRRYLSSGILIILCCCTSSKRIRTEDRWTVPTSTKSGNFPICHFGGPRHWYPHCLAATNYIRTRDLGFAKRAYYNAPD